MVVLSAFTDWACEWGLVDHVLAALDCALEAVEEEDAPDANGDVLFSLGQAIWYHVEHARLAAQVVRAGGAP